MNKTPLISVICPVYNKEPYIRDCINSVINQSYKNWELILVDDESPDNCPYICDEFAQSDNRIKVIHQSNKGHSESRNVGIRNATGDYIMFLDADDLIYDEKVFEHLVSKTVEKNLDICMSKISTISVSGEMKDSTFGYFDTNYDELNGLQVLCQMINSNHYHATMCSRLFKRQLIVDNNLYFKKMICDDEEWSPQLFYYSNRVGFINKNGYVIRKLNDSVTGSQDRKTCITKIKDKSQVSVALMEKFSDFDNVNSNQKKILFNKFYGFLNMSCYSLFHDLSPKQEPELVFELKQRYKEIKKYKKYFNLKNKLQYTVSLIKLNLV